MSVLSVQFFRSGNRAEREANLIFNQAGENQVSAESLDLFQVGNQEIKFGSGALAMRRGAFDKFSEIKNSALLLAFASKEIKQIKEIKHERACRAVARGYSPPSPVGLRRGRLARGVYPRAALCADPGARRLEIKRL